MIPYAQFDLVSAGMSPAFMWKNVLDEREERECYAEFRKFWPQVKYGGYGAHVRRVLRESFGIDDITDENYTEIGERLNGLRTPEHYKQVLQGECHIEYILNQAGNYHAYSAEDSYFIPHADMLKNGVVEDVKELLSQKANPTLEDHIELLRRRMAEGKEYGAKLVKYDASCFLHGEDYGTAKRQFEALKRGEAVDSEVLQSFVYRKTLPYARELGLVAAVHTGVWDNINRKSPCLLFSVVQENPDIRFDIYHMGMPFTGECAFLGKNFPNAYLDLCWSHIVSPQMLIRSLNEWLDLVPLNKILAFGGFACDGVSATFDPSTCTLEIDDTWGDIRAYVAIGFVTQQEGMLCVEANIYSDDYRKGEDRNQWISASVLSPQEASSDVEKVQIEELSYGLVNEEAYAGGGLTETTDLASLTEMRTGKNYVVVDFVIAATKDVLQGGEVYAGSIFTAVLGKTRRSSRRTRANSRRKTTRAERCSIFRTRRPKRARKRCGRY